MQHTTRLHSSRIISA